MLGIVHVIHTCTKYNYFIFFAPYGLVFIYLNFIVLGRGTQVQGLFFLPITTTISDICHEKLKLYKNTPRRSCLEVKHSDGE